MMMMMNSPSHHCFMLAANGSHSDY